MTFNEVTYKIRKLIPFKGDKVVWVVVLLLALFSLLAIYSSTGTLAYKFRSGDTEYYLFAQMKRMLVAFIAMYAAHRINYKYYSRIAQILLLIAIPLLIFTLITGSTLNEARRWITLPLIGISIQTSDIAKLALLMYLARLLAMKQHTIKDFKAAFLPIILPIIITCVLIFPANFSTAAILFTTSVIIMFIGRVSLKYIGSMIGIALVLVAILFLLASYYPKILPRSETWISRVESFQNPDSEENYQIEQSVIAIARGGLFGKTPGKSVQRNFLPHPYSDFIFAIIVEEYGLVGGSLVILLYLILLYRSIRISMRSPGSFGALLAIGLGFSLVFQAMINMAVAVNLIPVTGQPLPLISMGGSSLLITSIAIGIILSVSVASERNNQTADVEVNA